MTETTKEGFVPFRQIPTWSSDEVFQITGLQLKSIQRMFESYTELVKTFEPLFIESLDNGKIIINYEDLEGNPLQREDIDVMLQKHAQTIAQSMGEKK